MQNKHLIWALVDDRIGNKNQILGILDEINIPFKIFNIRYNVLANLPNFIIQLFGGKIHIKKKIFKEPYPSLILSCGRRTFPISYALKLSLNKTPFIFHLMYPKSSYNTKLCDLIFTPFHDNLKFKPNIIKTIGSPSIKNKTQVNELFNFKKPIISLLIGGDHGKFRFESEIIDLLVSEISKKLKNGSILISTSRRTSKKVIHRIDQLEKENSLIKNVYHPNIDLKNNPKSKMLFSSDEIVVTGDSTSMISEACQYRKPVRIFYNHKICASKHLSFCKYIIRKGYAFPFDTLLKKCNKLKTLKTAETISKTIMKYLNNERI